MTSFLRRLLADEKWADSRAPLALLVGATTFGILALELALIRWTSGQVRVFAYINNIVLITAFLGMGVGVALGRRHAGLVHFTLPALLLVSLPVAGSDMLGLVRLGFPDQSITLWGAEKVAGNPVQFAGHLAIFLVLLAVLGAVFVAAGAALGHLFGRLNVLRAYTADLCGSLAGIAAFTAIAWTNAGPAWWLAVGVIPFVWISRSWFLAGTAAVIVGLGLFSGLDAVYSPYNRIVLTRERLGLSLEVNRDFHQFIHNLSDARISDPALTPADRDLLRTVRELYDLPFIINPQRGSALVVGAGTGNDVQAALRNGYARITSVDIDGQILDIGKRMHPERPYDDPRVAIVNDDARAFFNRNLGARYDVVCYGLLDSHAMASAMSTLRLDNYVYTEDGIRAAWRHVTPGGHLSLAMGCYQGAWFVERLYWTIARATGRMPIAIYSGLGGGTVTFVVPGELATFKADAFARRERIVPAEKSAALTRTLDDDWPFLYLRPHIFPWGYLAVLTAVLGAAALAARTVFGVGRGTATFDWPLFMMGAAFLLIETRGVTSLSLLFGSTWLVNSAVFGGILTMVLAGNLAVQRWQWTNPVPWFLPLLAALALQYFFQISWLQDLPLVGRCLAGGLLIGLPVGFAGVIVPMLLARAKDAPAALGTNLLGAVLGGCLEYFSMLGGLRSLVLLALVLYLCALLALTREGARTHASAGSGGG